MGWGRGGGRGEGEGERERERERERRERERRENAEEVLCTLHEPNNPTLVSFYTFPSLDSTKALTLLWQQGLDFTV